MITHANLHANVTKIVSLKYDYSDGEGELLSTFSWLPQYHDLGLIFATIAPFAGGVRVHMMSPISFIQNPLLWFELMSKHQVNYTAGPDFSFRLVARKFREGRDASGGDSPILDLDLSSIRLLALTAEPIRPDTHTVISSLFGPYGLRDDWFGAAYGLAETVVFASYHRGYSTAGKGQFVAVGSKETLGEDVTIKIVDEKSCRELPDGETGELWLSSASVAAGYYGSPILSGDVFRAKLCGEHGDAVSERSSLNEATYLRTGDLAFFENNRLYICGRIKDLIIVNGVNFYPQDIEVSCFLCLLRSTVLAITYIPFWNTDWIKSVLFRTHLRLFDQVASLPFLLRKGNWILSLKSA